ncbi:MAG: hypothetical protein U5K51_09055 [Flavobacteriaceae bacterium]|nr:hypothetical protein [Flavobacteriaceae bacterium]
MKKLNFWIKKESDLKKNAFWNDKHNKVYEFITSNDDLMLIKLLISTRTDGRVNMLEVKTKLSLKIFLVTTKMPRDKIMGQFDY